jgi:hypothetical protein
LYGAFELIMQRDGPERGKKIEGKERQEIIFSQLFWQKVFDMDFPQKVFSAVFELSLLSIYNPQKRHPKSQKSLL